jgi:hypothetical protein
MSANYLNQSFFQKKKIQKVRLHAENLTYKFKLKKVKSNRKRLQYNRRDNEIYCYDGVKEIGLHFASLCAE